MKARSYCKCSECRKVSYPSLAKARKRLRKTAFAAGCKSAYACPHGNGWHLTHYPEYHK